MSYKSKLKHLKNMGKHLADANNPFTKTHEYKHARNTKIGRTLGDFGLAGNIKNRIARLKIENVPKLKASGGVWGRGHTHNPYNTAPYKKYRNAEYIANVEYKISKAKK